MFIACYHWSLRHALMNMDIIQLLDKDQLDGTSLYIYCNQYTSTKQFLKDYSAFTKTGCRQLLKQSTTDYRQLLKQQYRENSLVEFTHTGRNRCPYLRNIEIVIYIPVSEAITYLSFLYQLYCHFNIWSHEPIFFKMPIYM